MSRRLTVMQLLPELEVGGVEQGTVEIAQALTAAGHRAIVVSAGGRRVADLKACGAEHITLAIGAKRPRVIKTIAVLARLMRDNDVNVVHARSRLPAWIGWLARRRLPTTIQPRWLTTVHGPYSVNRYSRIMVSGERVIAISDFIRDYVTSNYAGVDPKRVTVIPRGVDPARYTPDFVPDAEWSARWAADYPALAQKFVLALPARLTRWKGQLEFVELIARLRQRDLPVAGLIIGDTHARKPAFRTEIEQAIATAGVGNDLHLTGQRSDMREILASVDCACSLTLEPEAFGRTTIEALALGTPVVGYDHGGTGEILRAVQPQGLVAVQDIDAAADRIPSLIEQPWPVPRQHPFTVQAMQQATLSLYHDVLEQWLGSTQPV